MTHNEQRIIDCAVAVAKAHREQELAITKRELAIADYDAKDVPEYWRQDAARRRAEADLAEAKLELNAAVAAYEAGL